MRRAREPTQYSPVESLKAWLRAAILNGGLLACMKWARFALDAWRRNCDATQPDPRAGWPAFAAQAVKFLAAKRPRRKALPRPPPGRRATLGARFVNPPDESYARCHRRAPAKKLERTPVRWLQTVPPLPPGVTTAPEPQSIAILALGIFPAVAKKLGKAPSVLCGRY